MTPLLFRRVLSLEARTQMSYRVDFWVNALVTFAVELTLAWFVWKAVFAASGAEEIEGFTFEGMVLYYVLVILLAKMVAGGRTESWLAQDIYEGSLTRYLVYPASYWGFKYAQHLARLAPAAIQLLLFTAISLLLFTLAEVTLPDGFQITAGNLVRTVIAVALANLLWFLLAVPVEGVAFWADNVWSLNLMLHIAADLLGGRILPLAVFPAWARDVMQWTPFPYLYSFPVRTLLGEVDGSAWLQALGVGGAWCLLLMWIGRSVWQRGYRVYSGVGI